MCNRYAFGRGRSNDNRCIELVSAARLGISKRSVYRALGMEDGMITAVTTTGSAGRGETAHQAMGAVAPDGYLLEQDGDARPQQRNCRRMVMA